MIGFGRSSGKNEANRRRLALGGLSALGIVAAAVITVCTNIMVARFYTRWDVTRGGLYSLSPPSLDTVRGLSERRGPHAEAIKLYEEDPAAKARRERLAEQHQLAATAFAHGEGKPSRQERDAIRRLKGKD